MASNKKPSIYSDRGNIGSAEELDEYGVWVKSEPQDMSAGSSGANKNGDSAFEEVSSVESSGGDDSLTFDDAVLDVKSSGSGESSKVEDIEFPDDNIEMENIDNSFSMDADLDDFNITDDSSAVSSNDSIEIEDAGFDEFEAPASGDDGEKTEAGEIDFNSDDFGGEEFDITSGSGDKTGEFGIPTVKAIENNIDNIQENFDEAVKTKESGDLSTHLLLKIANELSSIRGELSDLKKEFSLVRGSPPLDGKHDDSSGFFSEEDDETIALTGDELNNILSTSDEAPSDEAPSDEAPQDTQASIDDDDDEAIALTGDELDNILNSADFTEESGTNETPESEDEFPSEDEAPPETPPEAPEEGGDSDADFSSMDDFDLPQNEPDEAAAENEAIDIDIDGLNIDLDPDKLLSEQESAGTEDQSGDMDLDISDVELTDDIFGDASQSAAGETTENDIEIDFDKSKDSAELEKLRNDGASPITFPPENSSYLEEEEALPSDSFDLSDAVIDEPDLSTDGISDDLTEPSIDEEALPSGSLDLSDAVIDEPDLSTDGISDDLTEPSIDENEFDLNSLDDLTIDNLEMPEETEQTPQISKDDLDIDIDIPSASDSSAEEPAAHDDDMSFDIDSTDAFGTETEETPVSLDGASDESLTTDDLSFDNEPDESVASDDLSFDNALDEDIKLDDFSFDSDMDIGTGDEEDAQTAPEAALPPEPQASAPPPQAPPQPAAAASPPAAGLGAQSREKGKDGFEIPSELKSNLRNILSYMDQLLESLPEEKIEEFAKSEYFDSYKKLFKDLGLV